MHEKSDMALVLVVPVRQLRKLIGCLREKPFEIVPAKPRANS